MRTRTETIKHDTDLNEYEITIEIKESYDKNSGADIDGNRGMPRWFVEWENITHIICLTTGIETDPERLPSKLYDKLCEEFE